MAELERNFDSHTDLIFQCECANGDYLRISWDDEDIKWRYLWIEHHSRARGWQRITHAVRALFGKDIQNGEVILGPEVTAKIATFFADRLAEGPDSKPVMQ